MLPCVCSVIDHRWRQNVVRTNKWHTRRSRVCHWCSYHILTSSVSITESDARHHGIYLFYIITKSLFYFKIFQHNAKASILPRLCPAFILHEKKPFDVIWWIQNEAISLVAMRSWSRKIAPLSNLTRASLLVEWKLTAKAELNCEIYKSWRKCWKNQVSFCHRSSPVSRKAWALPWKLQELKNYPRKTCGYGQPRGHLIRVLNERSVNDGGDFRLLWLVILKSAWYSVGITFWLRYCWPWTVVSYT